MTRASILDVIKTIGELSKDGFFLYNPLTKALDYTNAALLKMFDISHASFSKQSEFFINHIIREDIDHLRSEYILFSEDGKAEDIEFRIKCHDGTIKNLVLSCYALQEKYIVGIIKDISPAKEHENYIINYGAKKDSLLDMVTHNLSGPLNISKNIIESLNKTINANDVRSITKHIELIRENTEHCIEIVNDFLEEEHLVSEQIHIKNNRFNVVDKLNTIIERIRKSYPDYNITVQCQHQDISINADDVKFLQIANNFISNAIKFSPANSTIEITIAETLEEVFITFKDQGIGIPKSLQDVLFQKNTPASRPGLNGEKSIGMGLYIVKKLTTLMNGKIDFESEENSGTTFTLTLPKGD